MITALPDLADIADKFKRLSGHDSKLMSSDIADAASLHGRYMNLLLQSKVSQNEIDAFAFLNQNMILFFSLQTTSKKRRADDTLAAQPQDDRRSALRRPSKKATTRAKTLNPDQPL